MLNVNPNKAGDTRTLDSPISLHPAASSLNSVPEHEPEVCGADTDKVVQFPPIQNTAATKGINRRTVKRPSGSHERQAMPQRIDGESFDDQLAAALQHAKEAHYSGALLMFRLSEHRVLAETFGHSVGVELTRLVAVRLRDCLRGGDIAARVAEDEFAIVLGHVKNAEQVAIVAERLIERCTGVYVLEGLRLHVNAAIGIARYLTDAKQPEQLMRYARIALNQADASHASSYHFFSQQQLDRQREQVWMAAELKQALEQERFELHYQPQYEIDSQRIVGMEALLRLNTESGEMIAPDRFIPVAEDNGLIIPMGHWVIREACNQLKRWRDNGCGPLRMAVNVSPKQLVDDRLIDVIDQAVEDAGLSYSDLELEITEQCIVEHLPVVEHILQELTAKGVRLAMDDFGTGYSSFAYLAQLPVTVMKLDRSFLANMEANPRTGRVVMGMIAMAKALALEVVAEGVETPEQQQFLEDAGCHLGQGYGFARPQKADAIEPLLKVHSALNHEIDTVEK